MRNSQSKGMPIPLSNTITKVLSASQLPYEPWPSDNDIPAFLEGLAQQVFSGALQRNDLLQWLVRLQQQFGWIHPQAIRWAVATLAATDSPISAEEIRGIIDFYSFLEKDWSPGYHLYLSTNVTDDFAGQQDNLAFFRTLQNRYPKRFRVTPTSCSGLCDQGPGALLNGYPIAGMNSEWRSTLTNLVEGKITPEDFFSKLSAVDDNIRVRDLLLDRQLSPGKALQHAMQLTPDAVIDEVKRAQLRGRGGAGFSTAFKWQGCRHSPGEHKIIICNADEGEPGTFKDRVLLQRHLDQVLDGMTIAAYAVGADHGYIYLRHEYQFLLQHLIDTITQRYQQGFLGKNILDHPSFQFDLHIHLGAGAYVCGEESALIESMEGKRGIPRVRPPYPAQQGYMGLPTVVNNVETFCCVSEIAINGGDQFAAQSCQGSTGTKVHSISGDCERPGIYELPFHTTIAEALTLAGATNTQAVQVGGPSGKLIFPHQFDRALNFSEVSSGGSFMIFDNSRDLFAIVKNFTDFFHHESCGFCTPCRVGCGILSEKLDKFAASHASDDDILHLREMMELMDVASHCGLGQTAAHPVRWLLEEKPDFFRQRKGQHGVLKINLRDVTSDARNIERIQSTGGNDGR